MHEVPSVERVRPRRCPTCGAAARPAGAPIALIGHGVRLRQVRGPLADDEPAALVVVEARRYRCLRCGGIATVVPRGALAQRHYGAPAVALALFLYGVVGLDAGAIRKRLSPWTIVGHEAVGRWASLDRWVRATADGRLFAPIRASPRGWSLRRRAERAAMTLVARAPPSFAGLRLEAQVVAGATHAG
jgi:hypothetical protein